MLTRLLRHKVKPPAMVGTGVRCATTSPASQQLHPMSLRPGWADPADLLTRGRRLALPESSPMGAW